MALKQGRIGSIPDAIQYDDGDFPTVMEVNDPIRVNAAPVDNNDVLRKADLASMAWPIGSIFLSVVSTNPNTLLGFGTWSQIAQGQFLVGFKTGDSDFDPVEHTGGNKTHDHPSTTSGVPSATVAVDNNGDGTTVNVGSDVHTHDTDLAAISHIPPFYVVYVWKRTA